MNCDGFSSQDGIVEGFRGGGGGHGGGGRGGGGRGGGGRGGGGHGGHGGHGGRGGFGGQGGRGWRGGRGGRGYYGYNNYGGSGYWPYWSYWGYWPYYDGYYYDMYDYPYYNWYDYPYYDPLYTDITTVPYVVDTSVQQVPLSSPVPQSMGRPQPTAEKFSGFGIEGFGTTSGWTSLLLLVVLLVLFYYLWTTYGPKTVAPLIPEKVDTQVPLAVNTSSVEAGKQ